MSVQVEGPECPSPSYTYLPDRVPFSEGSLTQDEEKFKLIYFTVSMNPVAANVLNRETEPPHFKPASPVMTHKSTQ